MRFDVVTLFPGIFSGYLQQSLLHKAIVEGRVAVHLHNLRDWTHDKHRSVDDRPFGGGPGMILMAPPVVDCVEALQSQGPPGRLVMLTPHGRRLNQARIQELARLERIVLLCGRYEGFDQRIADILQPEELSIGDFVLNGGEVAAMVVIDAVIRFVPGVLGDPDSAEQDSFSNPQGWLEGAQYTRPREFRGHQVPDVLLSGDHQRIAAWRAAQSRQRTELLRQDLLEQ